MVGAGPTASTCHSHRLSDAQLSAGVVRDDVRQVGVSFTENRDAVVSGVVKVPWGVLKRRQPSERRQPGQGGPLGTVGVVPVPWARLQGTRPELTVDSELVYTTAKAKKAKVSSPLQQLALRAAKPAVKAAEAKPKAVRVKIEGEDRKPPKKGKAEAKWKALAEGQAHMEQPASMWELLEERWPKGQRKPELHIASFERKRKEQRKPVPCEAGARAAYAAALAIGNDYAIRSTGQVTWVSYRAW